MIKKTIAEVRNQLGELVSMAFYKNETIIITRRGKSVAKITSASDEIVKKKEKKND